MGQCTSSWLHDLPLAEAELVRAQRAGAAETKKIVIASGLAGSSVELEVLSGDSVGAIRHRLADRLGVSLESVDLQLLSGSRILPDGGIAADLPEHGLQFLRVKKTQFATIATGVPGSSGWVAGVVAHNDKIYFAPRNATRVLAIDTHSAAAELIGPELPRGHGKYSAAGVLAPDGGKIYFAPFSANRVLAIDTHSAAAELIGPELTGGGCKYSAAGVLAPDGKIYFAPGGANRVLAIDTHSAAAELIGPELPEGHGKYSAAGVLAPDGKIYFAPRGPGDVLVVDP